MPTFEVRKNCEFVLQVEAKDEEEAITKASQMDESDWDKSWSCTEAEKVEG